MTQNSVMDVRMIGCRVCSGLSNSAPRHVQMVPYILLVMGIHRRERLRIRRGVCARSLKAQLVQIEILRGTEFLG